MSSKKKKIVCWQGKTRGRKRYLQHMQLANLCSWAPLKTNQMSINSKTEKEITVYTYNRILRSSNNHQSRVTSRTCYIYWSYTHHLDKSHSHNVGWENSGITEYSMSLFTYFPTQKNLEHRVISQDSGYLWVSGIWERAWLGVSEVLKIFYFLIHMGFSNALFVISHWANTFCVFSACLLYYNLKQFKLITLHNLKWVSQE